MTDCIIYFVKYPTPGMVKTRLARKSSPELAAEFYGVFAQEKLSELATGTDVDVLIFFAPDDAEEKMKEWLGKEHQFHPQTGDSLGSRMENAFNHAFEAGYERAILVGSDIPAFTPDIATKALAQLSPTTASIGPAKDGGYYLIGFHRQGMVSNIFHDMAWSTADVCRETISRLTANGSAVFELPQLNDMDTLDDVEELMALGPRSPLGRRAMTAARKLVER